METTLRNILFEALKTISPCERDAIPIESPREEKFGDLSTPVAMGLARELRKPPRAIAQAIIDRIPDRDVFSKIETAGPGFINFTFSPAFLHKAFRNLITERESSFRVNAGLGKRIQVEFVSANPTGPLHLGHGRGAALGAALCNLLSETGYEVEREYYVNDAGRQVALLGESVFARYKQQGGKDYPVPPDGYQGDYIGTLAGLFRQEHGNAFDDAGFGTAAETFTDFSCREMLRQIRDDLSAFGVTFTSWQSERELFQNGYVEKSLRELTGQGLIYEKDGALWFRSSDFGDEKDRVVRKQNGDFTYFATDIAYHRLKSEKGFDEMIDIWGADHHGYIPRVSAVVEALGHPREKIRILLVQMVSLMKGGVPVLMSKRSGEFITLREVVDELGPDTTKFLFLTRRNDSQLEIDIETAKAESKENPVFYVQYANARINSVFTKASEEGIVLPSEGGDDFDGALLNEEEMRIVRKLLLYSFVLKSAAIMREPHRITFYLQEIAGLFHHYYQKCRIVTEDSTLTRTRLSVCSAIRTIIRHGLGILGVRTPDRM